MYKMKNPIAVARIVLLALIAIGVTMHSFAQTVAVKPELGVWLNQTDGNTIGLELLSEQECNLFIEKLLQPRSSRACKYELAEGRSQVFLVGADGNCGSEADFEFSYDPIGPSVRFFIGSTDVLLHKQSNSTPE